MKAVIAKSFARIHAQNLLNFGILPLLFDDPMDWERISQNDVLEISDVHNLIQTGKKVKVINKTKNQTHMTHHFIAERELKQLLAGGLINLMKQKQSY